MLYYTTGWGLNFKYINCPRYIHQLPCPMPSLRDFGENPISLTPFNAELPVIMCIFMVKILFKNFFFMKHKV